MSLSNDFIEAVESGKSTRVKIMIKNNMLVDKSFSECEEMLAYAERKLPDIYDANNGTQFQTDSSLWNEDYLNDQLVEVVDNFSRERIAHIKEVIKYIYKVDSSKQTQNITEQESTSTTRTIGGVAAIAGTGMVIGGIISTSTALIVAGAVVGAAGVIAIVSDRK